MSAEGRPGYLRGCAACGGFFLLEWAPRDEDFIAGEPPPWTCRGCRQAKG